MGSPKPPAPMTLERSEAAFLGAELTAAAGLERSRLPAGAALPANSRRSQAGGRAGRASRADPRGPQECGSPTWCTWRPTRSATRWA